MFTTLAPSSLSGGLPSGKGPTIVINADRLLETFLDILRIDSYYPNEDPVFDILRPKLEQAGVEISTDVHRNQLCYWPGSGDHVDDPPIMLCAHMDTVWPTPDMEPELREGSVHSNGTSVLGADDKAAVAAIVEAVEAIHESGEAHPPAELLFTVGEDIGHIGSKAFDITPVRSRMAFIPDADGPVGGVMLAAPWTISVKTTFTGRAAHAGMEPENGRSALVMAAEAIQGMTLGRVDHQTTANVGTLNGGEAMNIIPATADMVWQVRSLSEKTFIKTRDAMYAACEDAAAAQLGALSHEQVGGTNGFRFPEDHLIVERARSAIQAAGLEPWTDVTCGGSDANELNDKGLDAVVISVGYVDIHTHQESMPIDQLNDLAAVCTQLILNN